MINNFIYVFFMNHELKANTEKETTIEKKNPSKSTPKLE